MPATLLTPADILRRPQAPARRKELLAQNPFSGLHRSQVSGAQIIGDGIDEKSMSFPAVISTPEIDRVGDSLDSLTCQTAAYHENPLIFLNHDSVSIPLGVAVDENDLLYVATEPERVLSRCFCVQGGKYGQDAADIFHLVIQRAFNDVSVGWNPSPDPRHTKRLESGGNRFEHWELLEWSLTGIGCNRGAKIIRKYLMDGKITGKWISPLLVKCLEPLAEQKIAQVTSGFASADSASASSAQQTPTKPKAKRWPKPSGKRADMKIKENHTASEAVREHPHEFSAEGRREEAHSGVAMHDGSFPIRNEQDLKDALHDVGRAKDPEAARRHISERAHALGLGSHLPSDWSERGGPAKSLTESNGTGGGYTVPESKPEEPKKPEDEKKPEEESDEIKEKDKKLATKAAQLAFHLGRGKAYQSMVKMLPAERKTALESCVHEKIPKIAEDHPEMAADQREAVAYSMCGEKAFGEYENKTPVAEEKPATEQNPAPIPEDTTQNRMPPDLELTQQCIENLESALSGLEPESVDFWEQLIEHIRNHGKQRYPNEDFGGEPPPPATPEQAASMAAADVDAYSRRPEAGERSAHAFYLKSLHALRKGDHLGAIKTFADTFHHYAKKKGYTLTRSDNDAFEEHGRKADMLHGAVASSSKEGEEGESPKEAEEDADKGEVEKLMQALVKSMEKRELPPVSGHNAPPSVLDRLHEIFGTRQ